MTTDVSPVSLPSSSDEGAGRASRGQERALFRTETGTRVHLRDCSHFEGDSAVREATVEERATMPICSSCQRELDGHGRTPCESLEDAFRRLPLPVELRVRARDLVAGITYDDIWVVYSGAYIALAPHGGAAVAWLHKSYFETKDGGRVEFPEHLARTSGGAQRSERVGDLCETHFVVRSLAGRCDECDAY